MLLNQLEPQLPNYEIFIGKAEYLSTEKISKQNLFDIPFNPPLEAKTNAILAPRLFMLKRKAFEYEDEIRILLVARTVSKKTGVEIPYTCKHTEIIGRVTLDPRLKDNTTKMLKDLFESKYGFQQKFSSKSMIPSVVKSTLYTCPKPETLYLR